MKITSKKRISSKHSYKDENMKYRNHKKYHYTYEPKRVQTNISVQQNSSRIFAEKLLSSEYSNISSSKESNGDDQPFEIHLKNFEFIPGNPKIKINTLVKWIIAENISNHDSGIYDQANRKFVLLINDLDVESDLLSENETFEYKFLNAGIYEITCCNYKRVKGIIQVTDDFNKNDEYNLYKNYKNRIFFEKFDNIIESVSSKNKNKPIQNSNSHQMNSDTYHERKIKFDINTENLEKLINDIDNERVEEIKDTLLKIKDDHVDLQKDESSQTTSQASDKKSTLVNDEKSFEIFENLLLQPLNCKESRLEISNINLIDIKHDENINYDNKHEDSDILISKSEKETKERQFADVYSSTKITFENEKLAQSEDIYNHKSENQSYKESKGSSPMILVNLPRPIQNLKELKLQELIVCGTLEEIGDISNDTIPKIGTNEAKFQDNFFNYIKNYFNNNGCTPAFRSPTMRWDLEQNKFMMDFLEESNFIPITIF